MVSAVLDTPYGPVSPTSSRMLSPTASATLLISSTVWVHDRRSLLGLGCARPFPQAAEAASMTAGRRTSSPVSKYLIDFAFLYDGIHAAHSREHGSHLEKHQSILFSGFGATFPTPCGFSRLGASRWVHDGVPLPNFVRLPRRPPKS